MNIILVYPNTAEEKNRFGKDRNEKELFNVVEYNLLDRDGQKCRNLMRGDDNYDPTDRNHYVINPASTNRELLLDSKTKRPIKTVANELHYKTKNGVPTKIELTGVQYLNVVNPITIFSQPADIALAQKEKMMAPATKVKAKTKSVAS